MKQKTIEITRSYSQKVNMGNYETKDHFCSAKCECSLEDAIKISKQLDDLVQNEVNKSINPVETDKNKTNESKYDNIKREEIQIPK